MNLRQLRYLVALADERHFTRAAAREHVAQPALSQQIRSLEAELGMALVERTTRRVAMTQAGELLVARARRALAELDAAQAELQSLAGVQAGRLSVGALHTMGPVDLSLLLATLPRALSGRSSSPSASSPARSSPAMLRDDEIDLAFLSVTERIQRRGLALRPLVSEELVVVLAPGHPLAARSAAAARRPRARSRSSASARARACASCSTARRRGAGFVPRIALESNESRRIRSLVSHGLGVAILPRSDAERPGDEPSPSATSSSRR